MKSTLRLSVLALLTILMVRCEKITETLEYKANVPVYLSYDALRSGVKYIDDKDLENPGKIFLYNQYILINDFERGVHIYDNSDPENPVHQAFINIPGNVDMAVKDGILYADSYVDLVAIDIRNPEDAKVIGRAEDVLSYTIPAGMDYNFPVSEIDKSKGVVVGYRIETIEETCEQGNCGNYYYSNWGSSQADFGLMSEAGAPTTFSGNATNTRSTVTPQGGTGIAGSMARFMLIDEFLYVISDVDELKVFSLGTDTPSEVHQSNPLQENFSWGNIETLFALNDRLFIGSNLGMLAYDVSSPSNPRFLSMYEHFTACDPVVANEDYAFVTLRDGRECGQASSELHILDIENIMDPSLIERHEMTNPFGLAIDNSSNLLFICDGPDGLKVFDFSNPQQIGQNQLTHFSGIETYDVILSNKLAMVIGTAGLQQFRYDDAGSLQELSTINLAQ